MYNKQDYYRRLVNKIFRLLPIYEGRDKDSGLYVYSPDEAYINYLNNLTTVATELEGFSERCDDGESVVGLEELISLLYGMKNVEVGEHSKVKTNVQAAIRKVKYIGGID